MCLLGVLFDILGAFQTPCPLTPARTVGSDVWMRPLVAQHAGLRSAFPALLHGHSGEGRSLLRLKHTQVCWAAKANATRDRWSFSFPGPLSSVIVANSAAGLALPLGGSSMFRGLFLGVCLSGACVPSHAHHAEQRMPDFDSCSSSCTRCDNECLIRQM